ncbi:MAG: polysaccharide biosynthesis tyrosine autokinase [Nitrospirae bacterium]|nr:polysaccharide biosynthesis tyrosine autokinase [Nitrospirota bacterium]
MSKLDSSIEKASRLRSDAVQVIRKEPLPASAFKIHSEDEEDQSHLRDYFNILLKRKWIVMAFFIPVVVIAALVSFFSKPLYKSSATIQIKAESSNLLTFKDIYGKVPDLEYYETQYNILKSHALAQRVVTRMGEEIEREVELASGNIIDSALQQITGEGGDNLKWADAGARDRALTNYLVSKIEVDPIKKSQLVNVNFISYDPVLGANLANTMADEYIKFTLDSKLEPTRQAKNRLEQEVEDMKVKLDKSEEQLNEYVRRNRIFFFNKEQNYENILTQKLSTLSKELNQATTERISREALYQEVEKSGTDYSFILQNSLIQSLTMDYIKQESEYVNLLKIHKPDYPKMLRLKEQIEKIKSSIEAEEQKLINTLDSDYKIAVKKEGYLASAIEALHKDVNTFQEKMGQLQILTREVDTNRDLHNSLLQRLKEVGISTALTESNVQVLDRAEIPKAPFKPNKAFNMALALMFGLSGGVLLAFFVEYFDRTIRTPDDVEKNSPVRVIGMVPISGQKTAKLVYANSNNNEAFTEAFRSLSTFIQFTNVSSPPKQILVTSPLQGEGKTILAVNAAMSLANFLGRGVVIDADFRRPKIHTFFDFDNSKGLSSFLTGDTELEGLARKSTRPGLDVITSGPMPPNPSELLNSLRMRELVEALSSSYDYVIIDSAPVLGISDSLILSALVESVILVVKSSNTPADALTQTYKLLNNVNATILGVVVNGVNPKTKYGYAYYQSPYGDAAKRAGKSVGKQT